MIVKLIFVLLFTVNALAHVTQWRDFGCYEPKDSHYALHHSTFESATMTTDSCARKCEKQKYMLFGLDDGGHCLCDNSVTGANKVSDKSCQVPCPADKGQRCGSGDSIRVLKILDESDAVYKWNAWSTWGSCSMTCGPTGKKKRVQQCIRILGKLQSPALATKCTGQPKPDFQSCNTHIPCSVYKWSEWSIWDECSETCGPNGKQQRSRQCIKITGPKKEVAQLSQCPGKLHSEEKRCNTNIKCHNKIKLTGCSQSSKHAWGDCNKAIDDNINQDWYKHSCSHTNQDNSAWWKGTTTQPVHVREVKIYNRKDCCAERLNSFVILVDGQPCAIHNSKTSFSVKTFKCNRIGHEVMIRSRAKGKSYLTLCEVQVFGDVIKHNGRKIRLTDCTQSSRHAWGGCHKAIDGNTNQDWYEKSCTHTISEQGWWKGTTHGLLYISEIKIFNRKDCCSERLNNFAILVDGRECAVYNSGISFSVKTFKCHRVGYEVMIQNRINTPLTLCEVEVYGYVIRNPYPRIRLSACSQSSTLWAGHCNRALDNNWLSASCAHTRRERGWWKASTIKPVHFKLVRIFNRQDCCRERLNNFAILVDGHESASYNSPSPFSVKSFQFDRIGRELMIQNRINTDMSLCEVQVFGIMLG